jgi:hypothetical protein
LNGNTTIPTGGEVKDTENSDLANQNTVIYMVDDEFALPSGVTDLSGMDMTHISDKLSGAIKIGEVSELAGGNVSATDSVNDVIESVATLNRKVKTSSRASSPRVLSPRILPTVAEESSQSDAMSGSTNGEEGSAKDDGLLQVRGVEC